MIEKVADFVAWFVALLFLERMSHRSFDFSDAVYQSKAQSTAEVGEYVKKEKMVT